VLRSVTVLDWDHRVVVIGEVGQAHDGSLGTAHAFVDAIADEPGVNDIYDQLKVFERAEGVL